MTSHRSTHEPDEELLSAEDAIADADRLEALFQACEKNVQNTSDGSEVNTSDQHVQIYIPLHLLLDAIDQLDQNALREVVQRAEERLRRAA